MNNKHFIFYYKRGTGTYIITEPRPWARENQAYFPNYDFINNEPRTKAIEDVLINQFGFIKEEFDTVTLLSNHNPNVGL